eukprot:Awhi_evm1s1254
MFGCIMINTDKDENELQDNNDKVEVDIGTPLEIIIDDGALADNDSSMTALDEGYLISTNSKYVTNVYGGKNDEEKKQKLKSDKDRRKNGIFISHMSTLIYYPIYAFWCLNGYWLYANHTNDYTLYLASNVRTLIPVLLLIFVLSIFFYFFWKEPEVVAKYHPSIIYTMASAGFCVVARVINFIGEAILFDHNIIDST